MHGSPRGLVKRLTPSDVTGFGEVLRLIATRGINIAAANFVTTAVQTVALASAGHWLGTPAQASFVVGLGLFNVLATGTTSGFLTAIDTLGSQAHGRGEAMAPLVVRVLLCLAPLCVALSLLFVFGGPIVGLVFDESLAVGAAEFLRWSPPYLFLSAVAYAMQRAFAAQQEPHLSLVASIAAFVASPIANYALVPRFQTAGLALALAVTALVNALVCAAFALRRSSPHRGGDRASLLPVRLTWSEATAVLSVALPAMVAVCAEWWAFEALVFVVAGGGPEPTAIFALLLNLIVLLTALPSGVFTACATIIGNRLGESRTALAREWSRVLVAAGLFFGAADALAVLTLGRWVIQLYTSDDAMLHNLATLMPAVAGLHFLDAQQMRLQYAYRSVGRQDESAKWTLIAMWLVGLPLSAGLSRIHGVSAIGRVALAMAGFCLGLVALVALLHFGTRRWDWQAITMAAAAAAAADGGDGDYGGGSEGAEMKSAPQPLQGSANPEAIALTLDDDGDEE